MSVKFDGFDWDDGNRAKCQRHGVSIEEVEEALSGIRFVVDDPSLVEKRYRTVGRTRAGRWVFAVFTMRGRRLRLISVRYMHAKEVHAYEEALANSEERRGGGTIRRNGGPH